MQKPDSAPARDREVEVDRLTRKFGKYGLVMAVSKRAREMKERGGRAALGPSPASYVERALRDVAEGRAKVVRGREE